MGDPNVKISVLMAVYNEKEKYLRRAIGSILCQTHADFEFIIIDDGSDDKKCQETLRQYVQKDSRIILIRNEKNLGLTKSLNKGLELAKSQYIARIDSDDIANLSRLEKQLKFMEENPNCALCGSWSYIIDKNSNIIGEKKFYTDYKTIKKKLLFFNFFTHSSLFFRRQIIKNIGGYNEKTKKAQDYDLILKVSARYPVANVSEFLCFNRSHSESITSETKKKQEWYAIRARFRAIGRYGYPLIYFYKIIPSLIYFLFVPYPIEQKLFKLLWHK